MVAACAIVVIIGIAVYACNRKPDRSTVRSAAYATADELERTPIRGLGIYSYDVADALDRATRGWSSRYRTSLASVIKVTDQGSDSRGSLFELADEDGGNAVCLIANWEVLGERPVFPSVTVDEAPC
jgi:hypothetical protein